MLYLNDIFCTFVKSAQREFQLAESFFHKFLPKRFDAKIIYLNLNYLVLADGELINCQETEYFAHFVVLLFAE